MRTYLDSSVLLRHLLGQPGAMDLAAVDHPVSSVLTRVECRRTLDRLRMKAGLGYDELLRRLDACEAMLATVALAQLDPVVMERAGGPLPVPLGTLDALHLATALLWKEQDGGEFRFATHDRALADAARGFGLAVVGV